MRTTGREGYEKFLDTVLSNYGKLITIQYACVHLIIRFGNRKRFFTKFKLV